MDFDALVSETLRLHRNRDVVFFLGAGASVGSAREQEDGNGLPLGSELAAMVAKEFEVDDQGGDLRKAASVAVLRRSSSAAVKRFVAEEVASRSRFPLDAHRALARVRPALVVTTNYDDLYEKALEELGERPAKVMSPEDIVHLPRGKPTVVKLHGDVGRPQSLVLTGEDYLDWEGNVEGLFADVTAEFRRGSCVFVGYSLADENLRRVIGLVRKQLGKYAPKYYALVHRVDEGTAAELGGSVEFVEGDATAFLQEVAGRWEREASGTFDFDAEENRLTEALTLGRFEEAVVACETLQPQYLTTGATYTAANVWERLANAAEESEQDEGRKVAAVARTRAGALYLEAGDDSTAETMLERALEHARAANMPPQEREIAPLLFQARLYDGNYYQTLQHADETLRAQGEDASPDLLLQLYLGRAEAKEALGDEDGALAELGAVLKKLPRDRLYGRTVVRCERARMLTSRVQWGEAREELNSAAEDLAAAPDSFQDDGGRERGEALVKLARGNVHQALGEDVRAKDMYEECERAFSETGDTALAISALRGSIRCRLLLGDFDLEAARARLRDRLKDSPEYRRIADKEENGITALAASRLAEARSTLLQAITAAQRVYDVERERGLRSWYADVLLAAGDVAGALRQYVLIGDAKKGAEVAESLAASVPGEPAPAFDALVADAVNAALRGSLYTRRAALVALTAMADLLPEGMLGALADGLSYMHEWPAGFWADRNVLSEAAELAQKVAPVLDDAQALSVGRGVVRALLRTDCFHATYKPLCSALSSLSAYHPGIVEDLGVPYDRLVELVDGDLINDTRNSMATLVNLARIGDLKAKEKALGLARNGGTPWHVRWRNYLGDASQEELSTTIREVLARGIDKVRQTEGGFQFNIGGLSPMFFKDWDLPKEVKAEVASTLSEAASDSTASISDRSEAATMLGTKASQLDTEGQRRAIESLLPLLAHEVEVHPIARSIDNPLSAMIMNVGQPDDIKAAAAYSLLRLSDWMGEEQRRRLMQEIEKLRASQIRAFGVSVGGGLRHFRPRNAGEQLWLQTRLLLLMNAPHSSVRDNAARCVGLIVKEGLLEFNPEIATTLVHLASSASVNDRLGASHALSGAQTSEWWRRPEIVAAFGKLAQDRSFLVREACGSLRDPSEQSEEQAS